MLLGRSLDLVTAYNCASDSTCSLPHWPCIGSPNYQPVSPAMCSFQVAEVGSGRQPKLVGLLESYSGPRRASPGHDSDSSAVIVSVGLCWV